MIRRRDLIDLFDTTPDLSGNDVDVARFIRDSSDRMIQVAWREIGDNKPLGRSPRREELCGVPIGDLRNWLKKNPAWYLDHLSRDRNQPWTRCTGRDLRDGIEVVLDASEGGYDSEIGWNPRSGRVSVIAAPDSQSMGVGFSPDDDMAMGDEPASLTDAWYPLVQHLADVERECTTLLEAFGASDLSAEMRNAAIVRGTAPRHRKSVAGMARRGIGHRTRRTTSRSRGTRPVCQDWQPQGSAVRSPVLPSRTRIGIGTNERGRVGVG